MNEFYQGMACSVSILGGLCAFIYWVFSLLEKRIDIKIGSLEDKIDHVATDIHRIAEELREERKSKDYLYRFVIENVRKD